MTGERRGGRVKPKIYQPKQAELERPFVIRNSDGTMPTSEEFAALRSVKSKS